MGDGSRYSRCQRFINEFNEDYKKHYNLKASVIVNQGLVIEEINIVVRYGIEFDVGTKNPLQTHCPEVIFDPDWDTEDAVENVAATLTLSQEDVWVKFDKAKL